MPLLTSRKQKKDVKVSFDAEMLNVEADGHNQVFPLAWYPQLFNATEEEKSAWTITGNIVRWEKLGIEIVI